MAIRSPSQEPLDRRGNHPPPGLAPHGRVWTGLEGQADAVPLHPAPHCRGPIIRVGLARVAEQPDPEGRGWTVCALEDAPEPPAGPTAMGMVRPKRQIFVDSFTFEVPKPEGNPKKSTAPRRKTAAKTKAKQKPTNWKKATPKAAPQPRAPKPRAQPISTEVEARKETRREYDRQRSQTPERKETENAAACN